MVLCKEISQKKRKEQQNKTNLYVIKSEMNVCPRMVETPEVQE